MRPGSDCIKPPFFHSLQVAFGARIAVVAAVLYEVVISIERIRSALFSFFLISVARMPAGKNKIFVKNKFTLLHIQEKEIHLQCTNQLIH